jgi:hypothetical protein
MRRPTTFQKPASANEYGARRRLLILFVILPVVAPVLRTQSFRSELIQLQSQIGLSFAWMHDGVKAVSFKKRAVIPVEGFLDVFRPDGFSFREYPQVMAIDLCWSHDQSKLAATMLDNAPNASLVILELRSKRTRVVVGRVSQTPHLTSQCWSPDDKQLVFETDGSVRVYDMESAKTTVLAAGMNPTWILSPTWSSDGNQIAFRDFDTYYSIQPSGVNRKKLFTQKGACSGLYWSPDSRIVAYVEELGVLQGGALDAEVNQLRMRRLEDSSDDWMANGVDCISNYKWLTNKALVAQVESAAQSK